MRKNIAKTLFLGFCGTVSTIFIVNCGASDPQVKKQSSQYIQIPEFESLNDKTN